MFANHFLMFESRISGTPQIWEAAALALLSGYVDCFTLPDYRVYASFMSGNTTQTGFHAGHGMFAAAGHNLLPIPIFVVGVFIGTLLVHRCHRRELQRTLLIVAGLLAAGAFAVHHSSPARPRIVVLSLAMGIMNTRVGNASRSLND